MNTSILYMPILYGKIIASEKTQLFLPYFLWAQYNTLYYTVEIIKLWFYVYMTKYKSFW